MPTQHENEQQEKQLFSFLRLWERTKNAFSSKKAWVLLAFFLFLLGVGAFVPVGKIPFLRNLAYAMGYTPDETQKISLLRALFSWNEHQKILRGELPDPDAVSVFGEGGGFLTSASARAQNKLINMRAVNSSLARRGKKQDELEGSSYSSGIATNGQQETGVKIPDTGVSAATQANATKPGEVYFGQDASAVARDKRDGYNSVNALKKIANPHIAGGSKGEDWLGRLVDKATRSDAGLDNIAKNVDKNGMLAKIGGVRDQGGSKAQKDLFYAWLFSKTARRTPNPVLKKTLASSGFNGGDLPKSVFSSSGFSGVGINPDDVIADMDNVTKYLELDEKCQEAIKRVGGQIDREKADIFSAIKNLTFPASCQEALGAAGGAYSRQVDNIIGQCRGIYNTYVNGLRQCVAANPSWGKCNAASNLTDHLNAFRQYCTGKLNECNSYPDPAAQATCRNNVNNLTENQFSGDKDLDPASTQKKDIFSVDDDGNPVWDDDDTRHEHGYVPQMGWGGLWVSNPD